jgi:hypothetical protein
MPKRPEQRRKNFFSSRIEEALSKTPRRSSPATARMVASASSAASLRILVSTFPRKGTTFTSGRRARTWRDGEDSTCQPARLSVNLLASDKWRKQGIARIRPFDQGTKNQSRRIPDRDILHRVNGQIDDSGQQGFLYLLGEKPLLPKVQKRTFLLFGLPIAGRAKRNDLYIAIVAKT